MYFPTILVVARDHDLRCTLQSILEQEGYWVLTVADRFEAACALNSFALADHVIVDRPELVKLVRSHAHFKNLPVTLLSSLKREEWQDETFAPTQVLNMPFELDELLVGLRRAQLEVASAAEVA